MIRPATPEDAESFLSIYAPYVRDTAVTFEYEVPGPEEFRERIRQTLTRYPWLAAESEGNVVGYAYTGPFKTRAAYDWSAETSIYLRTGCRRQGAGRQLYQTLEAVSKAQNLRNLYACIASPSGEDPHLTRDSIAFHDRMGYRLTGEFSRCGYKFGTWYNMVWMEKHIGDHPPEPDPFIPFPELPAETLQRIFSTLQQGRSAVMNCPKCGAAMEEGTLHTQKYPFWTQRELRFFWSPDDQVVIGPPDSEGASGALPDPFPSFPGAMLCRNCGLICFTGKLIEKAKK